jgi:hypothetical protein
MAAGKQGGVGWGDGGGTGGGVGDAGVEAGSSTVLEDFDFARELEMREGVMLLACKHHGQSLASEDAPTLPEVLRFVLKSPLCGDFRWEVY